MKKPLDFISLTEPETRRVSSLGIYGNRDDGTMRVIGGLSHQAGIVPSTKADADKMIAWLQDWKKKN